jgi:hypothetical protein
VMAVATPPEWLAATSIIAESGQALIGPPYIGWDIRDRRETGGQAAMAVGGNVSLAGWNLCPNSEPSVPL